MGFFERQFGEQLKKREQEPQKESKFHPVIANWFSLFLDNFGLILTLAPALVLLYLYLMVGSAFFLLGMTVALLLAGPAFTAIFCHGYEIARRVYQRKGFVAAYVSSIWQSVATMFLVGLAITQWILCSTVLTDSEAGMPIFIGICLFVEGYLIVSFAILSFSQIALVDLPLGKLWKNSLFLIPLTGKKGILVTLITMAFFAVVYTWISYLFLLVLFLGPTLLAAWIAYTLWPTLEKILVEEQEN